MSSALIDWLSKSGAQVHPSIAISPSPTGQNVVGSTAEIPSGSSILEIPISSILSVANGALIERVPGLANTPGWPALILTIMYESSLPDSKWRPYLESLPKEFDSLMYWAEDELKELKGSAVVDKIGKEEAEGMYHTDIREFIEEHQDLFKDVDTSLEAFHRTGSWIMAFSSDFEKPTPPGEDREMDDDDDEDDEDLNMFKAMVPFANLISGDSELANCEFTPSPTKVSLVSTQDIPAGSSLYIDPGLLPRSDLLRRLGTFPASSSKYDVVEIDSTLIISSAGRNLHDNIRDVRIEHLVEDDYLEDSYDVDVSGSVSSQILRIVQAFSVDDETFRSYVTNESFPKAEKNEKTRDIMLEVIEKRRALYETTIEEDVALLRSGGDMSKRKRMAIEVRLGEKEILRKMEDLVGNWSDEHAGGSSGRERKRRKL